MTAAVACPVCGSRFAAIGPGDLSPADGVAGESPPSLAEHLVELAARSDASHIMWMNRHVTKLQTTATQLSPLLEAALRGQGTASDRVRR